MKRRALGVATIAVVGSACALLGGMLVGQAAPPNQPAKGANVRVRDGKMPDGRPILPEGTHAFPNAVGRTCDPDETVRDFRRIYAWMDAFRRERGRLPTTKELVERVPAAGKRLNADDLIHPQWRYAEIGPSDLRSERKRQYALYFGADRADGTAKPAFPKPGERDVWLYSRLSAKSDPIFFPDGSVEKTFSGVYVVLFSDGAIEKLKHRQLIFVRNQRGELMIGFPGMAGLTREVVPFAELPGNKPSARNRVRYRD